MKISIIIPTHNRAETLRNAILSILSLDDKVDYEFVIVDNNSTDNTKEVIESFSPLAKYVFEANTSFSRARSTGALNASGDIFLYLDDDVLVKKGSLSEIIRIFTEYPDCGVLAGNIDSKFEEEPPRWALDCQSVYNGWSLFNSETYNFINQKFQEVPSAAGPMMAIRKYAYELVGGFPPDTVGVESNKGPKSFNKLYIGPGDYGLCYLIKNSGFKIYYSKDVSVFHVIPPIRSTVGFWRSRMIGEGYHGAITNRIFYKKNKNQLEVDRLNAEVNFYNFYNKIYRRLNQKGGVDAKALGIYPEELWLSYYKAYLDLDAVLNANENLAEFLWEIGKNGVSDLQYDSVLSKLTEQYKYLVSAEFVNKDCLIRSNEDLEELYLRRGIYKLDNISRPITAIRLFPKKIYLYLLGLLKL